MKKTANMVTAKLKQPTKMKVFCSPIPSIQDWIPKEIPKPMIFLNKIMVVMTCVSISL